MKQRIDFEETDPLAKRLSALDIHAPETLTARVLAARSGATPAGNRGLRRTVLAAIALVSLILANLAASYVSPRYAAALAQAPLVGTLTGPVLQQAGLATVGAEPLDVRATAAGYTVHLFGAYADGVRTTIFVQMLGPDGREAPDGTAPSFGTTLTDQFGHTYHMANGFGMPVIHFEPLSGPASTLGARLTLHVEDIVVNTPPAPGATTDTGTVVHGPWDLSFTVTSSGGTDLATPAPVQLGDTTYTFTGVRVTSSLLEISWTISGGAIERMDRLHREALATIRGHRAVPASRLRLQRLNSEELATSTLLDPGGKPIDPVYGAGKGIMRDGQVASMEMDAWYPVSAHGTYTFQVSQAATGSNARTITVP
jgi:hypothetical protein